MRCIKQALNSLLLNRTLVFVCYSNQSSLFKFVQKSVINNNFIFHELFTTLHYKRDRSFLSLNILYQENDIE